MVYDYMMPELMWKVNEVEMNSEFIFVKKNVQLFTSLLSVGEKSNYCK